MPENTKRNCQTIPSIYLLTPEDNELQAIAVSSERLRFNRNEVFLEFHDGEVKLIGNPAHEPMALGDLHLALYLHLLKKNDRGADVWGFQLTHFSLIDVPILSWKFDAPDPSFHGVRIPCESPNSRSNHFFGYLEHLESPV